MGKISKDRIKQRLKSLEINNNFQKRIKEIRDRLNIPQNGCKTAEELHSKIFSSYENNLVCSIKKDRSKDKSYWVEDILREFNISDLYEKFIEDYIYYNGFFANSVRKDFANKGIKANVFFEDDGMLCICDEENYKRKSKIYIEINAETTKKDIDEVYKEIKKMQKRLIGFKKSGRHKYSKLRNIDIDKRIYELKRKGLKSEEISEIIKKEFGGNKLIYNEVNKRGHEFKKRINEL